MAIAGSSGILRMQFGERPGFGNPQPEGIAVAHGEITGDASGGGVSFTFLSDGGFLYRLEVCQSTRGSTTNSLMSIIASSRWATERSGLGAGAFDLNWILLRTGGTGFAMHRIRTDDLIQIRRFPLGRTDQVSLQVMFTFLDSINTNNEDYEFDLVFSYWRTEAMYRPGFLQAFWEAPLVLPPGVR